VMLTFLFGTQAQRRFPTRLALVKRSIVIYLIHNMVYILLIVTRVKHTSARVLQGS
jgi:hypothetical protein